MKRKLNRRDFLKLAGLLPLGLTVPRFMRDTNLYQPAGKQNILVIVFDALSAMNISLNGYGRETTPNLARLAERAVVYHNHYSGGNYTTTGTANLLTGTLPWTHRAIKPNSGVADSVASHNIFDAFQGYYRTAFTHNGFAEKFLKQFRSYIEEWVPKQNLFLASYDGFIHTLFYNDDDVATVGWARNIEIGQGYSYSLFLSHIYSVLRKRRVAGIQSQYPRGIPSISDKVDTYYILDNAIDWLKSRLPVIPQPFFGYFHFLPPHAPYRTSLEFYNYFASDNLKPVEKPIDIFADYDIKTDSFYDLLKKRVEYDEFILYADKAFGDLYKFLEESGILENTWVVVTSDHGEMFERGLVGHSGPTLYQPVIRVPLLVFEPGRKVGVNIYTSTSAIDVLPTLMQVTGQKIPDWTEGVVLPPYAPTDPDPNRSIYALQAYYNDQYAPLTQVTVALIKGRYKLIYYLGYAKAKQDEVVLLFDLESDPDELVDLYSSKPDVAENLLAELKAKLAEVNKPYL
jgi:arylsulfatase A-like enzyme